MPAEAAAMLRGRMSYVTLVLAWVVALAVAVAVATALWAAVGLGV